MNTNSDTEYQSRLLNLLRSINLPRKNEWEIMDQKLLYQCLEGQIFWRVCAIWFSLRRYINAWALKVDWTIQTQAFLSQVLDPWALIKKSFLRKHDFNAFSLFIAPIILCIRTLPTQFHCRATSSALLARFFCEPLDLNKVSHSYHLLHFKRRITASMCPELYKYPFFFSPSSLSAKHRNELACSISNNTEWNFQHEAIQSLFDKLPTHHIHKVQ